MTNSSQGINQDFPELVKPTTSDQSPVYQVPERLLAGGQCPKPHVSSFEEYRKLWLESVTDPHTFWSKLATELLHWQAPFEVVQSGDFDWGDVAWFRGGKLNVAYNCVDRYANVDPDRVALIYEADEPGNSKHFTYGQLFREICRIANLLKSYGLRKGDTVAIYMPMLPQAVAAMLACARIGCPHTVVFAGFSAEALHDRIIDANCKVIFTADEGRRGNKPIRIKHIVDQALARGCPQVKKVVVLQRGDKPAEVIMTKGRDEWWHQAVQRHRTYCPVETMDAEDPLFLLYTSGSTGKPKGVVHSSAGYLLGAATTVKYAFDYHPGDIFGCVADVGWITGHTYVVYGPLALGATTVLFESVPTYPDAGRYWDLVAKHKITQFYTAPTAIRALRRLGDKWVEGKDLSSLRVIASVGEPINPEAWNWYNKVVGKGRCAVIDTYWQTETGSIVCTPLPGAIPTKPGSATVPFFGIDLAILDPDSGKELKGNNVEGVLAIRQPWPSMFRTVYETHERYLNGYMRVYKGFYFTGDGAHRDKDGYYWIRGRVDDVINVSGHRLSTAEVESALILHPSVAETAVVGQNDEITGQSICAFVTLKPQFEGKVDTKELVLQVRKVIGPFAAPKRVHLISELPKTRSGKIVRRVLRKVVNGEADSLGDLSTIADPNVVDIVIKQVSSSQ